MTENHENSGTLDKDILECRADILRARSALRQKADTEKPHDKVDKETPSSQRSNPTTSHSRIPSFEQVITRQVEIREQEHVNPDTPEPQPESAVADQAECDAPSTQEETPMREAGHIENSLNISSEKFVTDSPLDADSSDPQEVESETTIAKEIQDRLLEITVGPEPESQATDEEKEHKDQTIPKFDLAEQILVEHRRTTAARRKAPSSSPSRMQAYQADDTVGSVIQQTKRSIFGDNSPSNPLSNPTESLERITPNPSYTPPETHWLITEIVQRDIERLIRSGSYN